MTIHNYFEIIEILANSRYTDAVNDMIEGKKVNNKSFIKAYCKLIEQDDKNQVFYYASNGKTLRLTERALKDLLKMIVRKEQENN